jgi:hypothetical protein
MNERVKKHRNKPIKEPIFPSFLCLMLLHGVKSRNEIRRRAQVEEAATTQGMGANDARRGGGAATATAPACAPSRLKSTPAKLWMAPSLGK